MTEKSAITRQLKSRRFIKRNRNFVAAKINFSIINFKRRPRSAAAYSSAESANRCSSDRDLLVASFESIIYLLFWVLFSVERSAEKTARNENKQRKAQNDCDAPD
jgi:hypothetical protein